MAGSQNKPLRHRALPQSLCQRRHGALGAAPRLHKFLIFTSLLWGVVALPFPASSLDSSDAVSPRSGTSLGAHTTMPALIVKYRASGDHALLECAERLSRDGEAFAAHTSDASPSLDHLHKRLGVRSHRALMRSAGAVNLEAERRKLRQRAFRGKIRRARNRAATSAANRNLLKARPSGHKRQLATEAALADLAHVYRVALPPGIKVSEAARRLSADPHVEYAVPDFRVDLDQAVPFNDPFLQSEGSWGQGFPDLWGLTKIRAPEAWRTSLGEGQIVAVVDTGLDWEHPDIRDNLWVNPGEDLNQDGRFDLSDENGLDDDGNGFIDDLIGFDFAASIDADQDGAYDGPQDLNDPDPFDVRGHGTHVSGTIAAVADNGEGIVGVAPGARLMALKGFPDEGAATASQLWRAVLYAAEMGATVVNNSWSCSAPCPSNPLAEDVLEVVEALGTVVVTSAGNRMADVSLYSPENTGLVLTVGAIGHDESLASFSNKGWGVDVVAPGGGPSTGGGVRVPRRNILSLAPLAGLENEELFIIDGRYRRLAGTSMSAPHVAGAVALLKSVAPDLTPHEVRATIRSAVRDLGAPGHDPFFGPGLLDLAQLVEATPVDVRVEWQGPATGELLDPEEGDVRIRVEATGSDVVSIQLSIGEGMSGRPFETVERYAGSRDDFGTTSDGAWAEADWHLESVADGAYALRARVTRLGGEHYDDYRVLGIERVRATELADGNLDVGTPAVDGDFAIWPMERAGVEDEDGDQVDLVLRALPSRHSETEKDGKALAAEAGDDEGVSQRDPVYRFPVTGTPRDLVVDRGVVAWRAFSGTRFGIAWCRLERNGRPARSRGKGASSVAPIDCTEQIVAIGPGNLSLPQVGRGWLVWQRDDGASRIIEGCYVGRRSKQCDPVPLVDLTQGSRWQLRSFDGYSLLLQEGAVLARCLISRGGGTCAPEPIEMAIGAPSITEVVHDKGLLVLGETALSVQPSLGCLPAESNASCRRNFAVTLQYYACLLEGADSVCDPIPITEVARAERFAGIDVSRGRIAWSLAKHLEEPSIRFCEFDEVRRECRSQRITGAMSAQNAPRLDGKNLVWRGGRLGGPSIWSHRIPDFSIPKRRRVRAGQKVSVAARADAGSAAALRYEILPAEVGPAAESRVREWKLKVRDPAAPGGRVRLVGRVPRNEEGTLRVRIRAVTEDGLASESTIELKVRRKPNAWGRIRPFEFPWRW